MWKGRVLVVDDEAASRSTLAELLVEHGYAVETAVEGNGALAKLRAFAPDVMLTDLDMPGMSGMDLLRHVRRESLDTPSVMVMSAFTSSESGVQALAEGATHYLQKPLNTQEVLLVVARELDRTHLQREVEDLRGRLSRSELFGEIRIPGSTLQEIERYAILKALEASSGSTSKAADMLRISVRKIQYKIQEYRTTPTVYSGVHSRTS